MMEQSSPRQAHHTLPPLIQHSYTYSTLHIHIPSICYYSTSSLGQSIIEQQQKLSVSNNKQKQQKIDVGTNVVAVKWWGEPDHDSVLLKPNIDISGTHPSPANQHIEHDEMIKHRACCYNIVVPNQAFHTYLKDCHWLQLEIYHWSGNENDVKRAIRKYKQRANNTNR